MQPLLLGDLQVKYQCRQGPGVSSPTCSSNCCGIMVWRALQAFFAASLCRRIMPFGKPSGDFTGADSSVLC